MKIAVTSCMNIRQLTDQPVWQQIGAHQPDALVLLGDSIYSDVPWPMLEGAPVSVQDMRLNDFQRHLHGLYLAQLQEPNFAALVQSVPRSFAIWDDHDFLWNNAQGGRLAQTEKAKIEASSALFRAYRLALAQRAPGSFPANAGEASLWPPANTTPLWRSEELSADVFLHLCDTRSYKDRHTLLGQAQRDALAQALQKHPQALHLLASGVTFNVKECWQNHPTDHAWLKDLARQFRIVLLSGDIHLNQTQAHPLDEHRFLFEVTASGAAIKPPLIFPGQPTGNFAIVTIDAAAVHAQCYSQGPQKCPRLAIDRATWQPLG